jgi:spore maturation protein CgeB
MVLRAMEWRPDLLVVIGQQPVRSGALCQIKAALDIGLVYVWPDTMLNLAENTVTCLPIYDLVGTYSSSTVALTERLGAKQAIWLPLAGDPSLHSGASCSESERRAYAAEVAFIGGWRPEREEVLSKLGAFDLKIWGPDWGRRCRTNPTIMKTWQGRRLTGEEFAKAVACSKINLNVIDPTNYPAANMRFFEILVAGGLQVCSSCPEMETEFRSREHIIFYQSGGELLDLIEELRKNDELRARVAAAGHGRVMEKHTYKHRAQTILEHITPQRN